LDALDNEIEIIADVDGDCTGEFPACPFYGMARATSEDPPAIYSIQSTGGDIVETKISDITDDSPGDSNYPNGLAFDDDNDIWYFAEEDGTLKTLNEDGSLGEESYGVISPDDEPIAGASFHDGLYYFIPNGGDELWTADISGGTADTDKVADLDWSDIGLGDIAIDTDNEIAYVSTTDSNDGPVFFSIDLNDPSDQQPIADGPDDEDAVGMQLAFENGTLWAHEAEGGDWYTVEKTDGSLSDVVETTGEYTDLAACGFAE
ncbi:MAG: hypothetical protein ACOCUO_00495, partial [archaeon]